MPIYKNNQLLFINGSTGTSIVYNSVNSPSISTNQIVASNGTGSANTILSTTGSSLSWISPSTVDNNIQSNININTLTATTINCTNMNATSISNLNTFANQVTFNNPPTSGNTGISTQLITKQYVDNKKISNRTNGIYNLYLNKSQTFIPVGVTAYFTLSNTVSSAITQGITGQTVQNVNTLIGTFMTDNTVGITSIPISLWNLNIYAGIPDTGGTFYMFFQLYKYNTINNTFTIIGTSSNSSDVNATPSVYPDLYTMSYAVTTVQSVLSTDKIAIRLYYNTSYATSVLYKTYFENNNYSYLQIIVNNNQLIQKFGTATSTLDMSTFNITSSDNLNISCPSNILTVGNSSSTINIGTDTTIPSTINLSSSNGTLNFDKTLTLNYGTTMGNNQLGQIITYTNTTRTSKSFTTNSPVTESYFLPYKGIWFVSANAGIYSSAGSTITYILLSIKNNTTNTIVGSCEQTGSQNITYGYNNILNCSGIITATQNNTRIDIIQTIKFPAGSVTYKTFNSVSDTYNIQFVRIA